MERAPRVSVIVPAYNVERFIDQALASIEAQTLYDIEIICAGLPKLYEKLLGCTIRYALGKKWERNLELASECAAMLDTEIKRSKRIGKIGKFLPAASKLDRVNSAAALEEYSFLPDPFTA